VGGVLARHRLGVPLAGDEQPTQAVAPDRPHRAFGVRPRFGRCTGTGCSRSTCRSGRDPRRSGRSALQRALVRRLGDDQKLTPPRPPGATLTEVVRIRGSHGAAGAHNHVRWSRVPRHAPGRR
jgi:hypothetical protein